MATHDYVIANGTGAAVRADLNDALAAIVSNNSSSTEPATTYAYQWWVDTTTNVLKIRNSANNGWITLRELDGTMLIEDGTASLPGLAFADDTNTGIFSGGADEINISTGGTERVVVNSSGDVGIGIASPSAILNLDRPDLSTDTWLRVSQSGTEVFSISQPSSSEIRFATPDLGADRGYTFHTKGAETMRLTAAGRLGIGTTSPSNALHVNSGTTDTVALFESGDTTARIILRDDTSTSGGYLGVVGEELTLSTNGSERVRIDSSGEVGIGTSSPGRPLQVAMNSAGATVASLVNTGGSGAQIGFQSSSLGSDATVRVGAEGTNFAAYTNNTERVRVDSAGRLLVGTSTSINNLLNGAVQIVGTSVDAYQTITRYSTAAASGAGIVLGRSKSGTKGTNTAVANGDILGAVSFSGADGSNFRQAAQISAFVDGAVSGGGAADMPGRLVFLTSSDGSATPSERFRIAKNGAWGLAGANYGSSGQVLTSNGSGSAPTWQTSGGGAGTLKAWVNFNGTGTVAIRGSGNVSSITDNGTGDYTVNFTTAMSDSNYAAVASPSGQYSINYGGQTGVFSTGSYTEAAPSTGSARMTFSNYSSGTFDPKYVCVAIFR